MYFMPETEEIFTSVSEIRSALWVRFSRILPDLIDDVVLAGTGVFPVAGAEPIPAPGQVAVPVGVAFDGDRWVREWVVRDMTLDEVEAAKPLVPQEVTMRQARLALLAIGKLDQVPPAIESLVGADRDIARIEWEFSSTVVRSRALVVMLGQALGLNDEALDQLFITAARL